VIIVAPNGADASASRPAAAHPALGRAASPASRSAQRARWQQDELPALGIQNRVPKARHGRALDHERGAVQETESGGYVEFRASERVDLRRVRDVAPSEGERIVAAGADRDRQGREDRGDSEGSPRPA
jgi:hypothetical protein